MSRKPKKTENIIVSETSNMLYKASGIITDSASETDSELAQPNNGVSDYPVNVSFVELAELHSHSVEWKWHPEVECIVVNHGSIEFMTTDTSEVLLAGQGIVVNANVMHSIKPSSDNYNCSFYSVTFHPDFVFNSRDNFLFRKYISERVSSSNIKYIKLEDENSQHEPLLTYINEIIADNLIKKMGYELITKAKLCLLTVNLIEYVSKSTPAPKLSRLEVADGARAKEIIIYIQQNYSRKITLDELAEHVNISKSECCRCFKRALDITPIEYLMRYRISMATSLIQNGDPKNRFFADLSAKVGFNNASYFNKLFRQYVGCTPSEYRRQLKKGLVYDPFNGMSF